MRQVVKGLTHSNYLPAHMTRYVSKSSVKKNLILFFTARRNTKEQLGVKTTLPLFIFFQLR